MSEEYNPLKVYASVPPSGKPNGSYAVRVLFLMGAFFMLITLPFVSTALSLPLLFALLAILILEFMAGLMIPRHRYMAVMTTVVAAAAVFIFEYLAVQGRQTGNPGFFWVHQLLAIIFFFAFYASCKTLRFSSR